MFKNERERKRGIEKYIKELRSNFKENFCIKHVILRLGYFLINPTIENLWHMIDEHLIFT